MKIFLLINILLMSFSFSNVRSIPYFENKELTPFWPSDGVKHIPAKVGAFTALNHDDQKLTEKDFGGHISLVNFFFVQCPDVCPLMMKNVKKLQKAVGKQAKNIQIYSFSVQPELDTPKRLKSYAKTYKIDLENWTLLTGEKKEIYHVGKNMFRADGSVGSQKSEDSFIHTQNIYLLDKNRNIRGIYNTNDPKDMGQLKEDIVLLKQE